MKSNIEFEITKSGAGNYYCIDYYGYYTGIWAYTKEELQPIIDKPTERLLHNIEEIKKYPSFGKSETAALFGTGFAIKKK